MGATLLTSMAIAGCGTATETPSHRLHGAAEKRLLNLVAHARSDVASRRGAAAHTALTEFISDVHTLRTAGELTAATAGGLDRQAKATAAQIGSRMRSTRTLARSASSGTTETTPAQTATATLTRPRHSGNTATHPIAIPVKHDRTPTVRVPDLLGHDGRHPFGDGNHRFPHGPGDGQWGDRIGAGGD